MKLNKMLAFSDYEGEVKARPLQQSFADTLDRPHVARVTADREADQLIVTLAVQLKCPIVTNDSDFFIIGPYWDEVNSFAFVPFDNFINHIN